jgi:hypothetical protein
MNPWIHRIVIAAIAGGLGAFLLTPAANTPTAETLQNDELVRRMRSAEPVCAPYQVSGSNERCQNPRYYSYYYFPPYMAGMMMGGMMMNDFHRRRGFRSSRRIRSSGSFRGVGGSGSRGGFGK